MIKANELRIGNYFYIGELIGQCNAASFVSTNQYDPIPLTHSVLAACGFKEDRVYKYRMQLESVILHKSMIDMYKKDIPSNRCYQLALDYGQLLKTEIQYLHQLQNLYHALTGTELTIDTSKL